MSLVIAMQVDHNGDHQFIVTLSRQAISSSNSTLFIRQRSKLAKAKRSSHGYGSIDIRFKPTIEWTSVITKPSSSKHASRP